jgi:hypothetical protein
MCVVQEQIWTLVCQTLSSLTRVAGRQGRHDGLKRDVTNGSRELPGGWHTVTGERMWNHRAPKA